MILALLLTAAAGPPNLLLVTIDTLRADRVGAYGHSSAQTPVLDRLAREGVLLEDAVVQVPQTRPSHASILTGRYPYEHGIRDNYSASLEARIPTLATLLKRQGYATAAFIGAYPVSRPAGLDRGFDVYDDPFGAGESSTTRDPRLERTADKVVEPALAWLARPRSAPFFAWVHLFDPHAPYEAPAPFGARFAKSPYDGEIAFADAQIGRLLEWLDRSGARGQTLVVVTSDHGEGLGEHGEDEHMLFVYDSTLRVPLVVSFPGRLAAGARVAGQFRSVDIVPTVLDLLGLPPAPASGASRAEVLRRGGKLPDNESYAESLYGRLHFGWAPLRALRGEGWKLIDAPKPELYRLTDDPRETRNLVEARGPVAAGMRSRLSVHEKADASLPVPTAGGVDAQAAERLAALGYVGGGLFAGPLTGTDPKDKIGEYQAYRRDTLRALRLFRARDLDGAIRILDRLSKAASTDGANVLERRSFNVEYFLGRSLVEKGRYAEAVPHLEGAVVMAPTSVPARIFLAQALGGAREPARALKVIGEGLVRAPDNPELLQAQGGLLLRQGRPAEARAALEKARAQDAASVSVRVDLAALYRNLGDLPGARAAADEALKLDPRSPEAHVEKGLGLGAQGRVPDAAREFRSALEADPKQPDALFYLAAIELQAGRAQVALPLLERLTRAAPAYPGGQEALAAARRASGAAGAAPAAAGSAQGGRATPGGQSPSVTVRLRLIRVTTRPAAEEVVRRVSSGEDFAALARDLSVDSTARSGGDLGAVRPADLAEPLRSVAGALRVRETSAVIETANGFVILRREK